MSKVISILTILFILTPSSLLLSQEKKLRVATARANIYAEPDALSTIIEKVEKGTILTLLSAAKVRNIWYFVSFYSKERSATVSGFVKALEVEVIEVTPKIIKEEKKPGVTPVKPPKAHPLLATLEEKTGRDKKFLVKFRYNMDLSEYTKSASWSEEIYYENAQYNINDNFRKGNSFDICFGYEFSSSIGVELGIDVCSRKILADYSASIPHPLLFNSPRDDQKEGNYKLKENAIYLNFVCSFPFDKFSLDVFGGPAYFLSNMELIKEIQFSEYYPYDTVNISASFENMKKNTFGFNVGANFNYHLAVGFGIFLSAQYFSSSADFKPTSDIPALKVFLGGFKTGIGLKILF